MLRVRIIVRPNNIIGLAALCAAADAGRWASGVNMNYLAIGPRVRSRLDSLVADLAALIKSLSVKYFSRYGGNVVVVAPEYYLESPSPEQAARQIELKRVYDEWFELLSVVLSSTPDAVSHQLKSADQAFRTWIELGSNWSLTRDPVRNQEALRESARPLYALVEILEASRSGEIVVLPDTGTLMEHPDPVQYRHLVSTDTFAFLLLPSVLQELDDLKVNHRSPDVRELAKSAIRRVKGWRQQGSLRTGVTVDRTITVRAAHQEPDMSKTLSWLDPSVKDDRIVASTLAIQASLPGAAVILVTSDINLQNKADAAALQVAEFPDV